MAEDYFLTELYLRVFCGLTHISALPQVIHRHNVLFLWTCQRAEILLRTSNLCSVRHAARNPRSIQEGEPHHGWKKDQNSHI